MTYLETLKRISDNWNKEFGLVGDDESTNGPYNITRAVLLALADEIEQDEWLDGSQWNGSYSADDLRSIANAKPNPLDELSWEFRLGYEAAKAAKGKKFADDIYLVELGLFTTAELRSQYNAAAQAAIQYAEMNGGDK